MSRVFKPDSGQSLVLQHEGGSAALTINTDGNTVIADGNRIQTDEVRAYDGAGLKLYDDAGTVGIFVEDGGQVGIGTASPSCALTVSAGTSANAINIYGRHDPSGSMDDYGIITFYTDDGATIKGNIQVNASDDMIFRTGPSSNRLIIDSSGNTKPATDNSYDIGTSSFRWDDVYATNGIIQTSDERMKTNIAVSSLGLNFINQLNPVEYKWKDYSYKEKVSSIDEIEDAVFETKTKTFIRKHYGLIAQEVEQVLKNNGIKTKDFAPLIYDKDSDRYGMRYGEMVGIILKAIQELSAKVTALENG